MQINLLPQGLQRRKTAAVLRDLKKSFLFLLGLWIILVGLFLVIKLNIVNLNRRLSKIEDDWKQTAPLLTERENLIKRKQQSLEFLDLVKQHSGVGLLCSEKMFILSQIVPEEVWFREICLRRQVDPEGELLFLDIKASISFLQSDEEMLHTINNFIGLIKEDRSFFKDFQSLTLSKINKVKGKENTMDFDFTLSLK